MSLVTLAEALQWCGVTDEVFTITAGNDVLILTSDQGTANIDVEDGTYNGTDAATALQTAMNADDTLTGGTITFAVSWSATTRKFTIDATAGHTIAYTNTGSDAGLTFGFSADASAAQTITSDTACGDPTNDVETIWSWVDTEVKKYCKRDFESTTYSEWIDGKGEPSLWIQYPIIGFYRACLGTQNAIQISSSSTCTYAQASLTSTTLSLVIVGGTDAGTNSITLASYATLTLLVAAINAITGWTASLVDSDYGIYPYTELKPDKGIYCTDTYGYLRIPETPETDLEITEDTGRVYRYGGWPSGVNNIYMNYQAGYSTIPYDLVGAVLTIIRFYYQKQADGTWGLDNYNTGGVVGNFAGDIPEEARRVLDRYRRLGA